MLNWLRDLRTRRAVQAARREALRVCGGRPSRQIKSAIQKTSAAVGPSLTSDGLRRHRGRVVFILARQLADANERLGKSYWTGPDGHNVGRDVLQAYGVALGVCRGSGSDGGRPPASIAELIERLTEQSAIYRSSALDPDGYGSGTLGEIERDLLHLQAQTQSSRA